MNTNNVEMKLKNLATLEREKEFKVVIVCNESANPEEFPLKGYKKLMKNIISGSLTGQRILELSMNEKIVSIEEDMGVNLI